ARLGRLDRNVGGLCSSREYSEWRSLGILPPPTDSDRSLICCSPKCLRHLRRERFSATFTTITELDQQILRRWKRLLLERRRAACFWRKSRLRGEAVAHTRGIRRGRWGAGAR